MSRIALVTGAGQSVGRGIAEVLAAAGVAVAVNDLVEQRAEQTVESIAAAGGRALAVPFDVTSRPAVIEGIDQVTNVLGPVDILVNNAGVADDRPVLFLDSDPSEWHANFDLNVFGSLNCIHAVAPGMVARQWGRIVQISSSTSSTGLSFGVSLYGASKAGIEGFIRHFASELGATGVTVNALALGLMENVAAKDQPELFDALLARIPVQRFGKPTEVGAAVRWLASDDGAFVTGQVIHVNGGTYYGR